MKAGWPMVPLGDVSSSRLGKMLSKASKSGADELPYLGNAEVQWGRIRKTQLRTMNFTPAEQEEFSLRAGDVLICEGGEVGRTAIVEQDLTGVYFQKALHRVRCSDRLQPRFLYHYMRFASTRGGFDDYSSRATIAHLTGVKLRTLPIPLPPLEEQSRIAAILDKADELRAKRRAAIAHLDSLTQAIFLDMFGDPAHNPMGWPAASLGQVAKGAGGVKCGPFGTQLSQSEYRHDGVPLWGIKQVNKGFEIPTREYLSEEKAGALADYDLLAGDIVMTRKGTVGNCAVYPSGFPVGIMHSDLLRIRLAEADPEFMASQLRFSRAVAHQISLISGGAVMPGINVTKLKLLEVLVPPIALQTEYSTRIKAVSEHREIVASADTATGGLAASLATRAFRGDL